jgi:hypothetical protein
MAVALRWLALLSMSAWSTVAAQQLRGTVTDRDSNEPVRGVVLTLLDSAGMRIVATISNEAGEFTLPWSARGSRLRAMRLGFRPTDVAFTPSADIPPSVRVAMLRVSTLLEAVQVSAERCPRRGRGSAMSLFEHAKAALLASVESQHAVPATLVRLVYERTMDGSSDRIERQVVEMDSTTSSRRAFGAARDPGAFVRRGFMEEIADEQMFYAPDADVLLHEDFAIGYCFAITDAQRARGNQVGLAFHPRDQQPDRIDVEGALWIDTLARELRDIEFRYLGLDPKLERFRPGGRISFREMPNGLVLIDRWHLRLVGARADTLPRRDGDVDVLSRLYATETGGEVVRARWSSGTFWQAALGTLDGTGMRQSGTAAAGAVVAIENTPYRATLDSSGRFTLHDLLPGPYALVAMDPRLDSLGVVIPVGLRFTAVRDSTRRATVTIPTAEEFVRKMCAGYARSDDAAPLLLRVLDPNGEPMRGVRLDIESSADRNLQERRVGAFTVMGSPGARQVVRENAVTGTDGLMPVCSPFFARGARVFVRARSGRRDVTFMRRVDSKLTIMQIVMPSSVAGLSSARLAASLVAAATRQPVADAELLLPALSRGAFSDSAGKARLEGLPPGTHELVIRKLGYRELRGHVTVDGTMKEHSFVMNTLPVLDTVVVRETGLLPEFEEHRRIGLGQFLTRSDLEARAGQHLSAMMRQLRGAAVMDGFGTKSWVLSSRAPAQLSSITHAQRNEHPSVWCPDDSGLRAYGYKCGCYARVYLDGTLMNPQRPAEPFDINSIPTETMEAVEWYAGPSQLPLKYSKLDSTCGVLVIHTRRPP